MVTENTLHKKGIYEKFFKRFLDILLCSMAVIVLSPILFILTVCGAVFMGGNPFFTQQRPGKNEKIFKLVKFRTMDNRKDADGNLLPDTVRLNKYGRFLRATSLDELPELFNIIKGDMSIVGPRPLLVKYLPRYNAEQHRRHNVRPGLTGLAQVNGRNNQSWNERFELDLKYVKNISFILDFKIVIRTILIVLKSENIDSEETNQYTKLEFVGSENVENENTIFFN